LREEDLIFLAHFFILQLLPARLSLAVLAAQLRLFICDVLYLRPVAVGSVTSMVGLQLLCFATPLRKAFVHPAGNSEARHCPDPEARGESEGDAESRR